MKILGIGMNYRKHAAELGMAVPTEPVIFLMPETALVNFGKYKNQPVKDVFRKDPGYYNWILNAEFPLYTKRVLTKVKLEMSK